MRSLKLAWKHLHHTSETGGYIRGSAGSLDEEDVAPESLSLKDIAHTALQRKYGLSHQLKIQGVPKRRFDKRTGHKRCQS